MAASGKGSCGPVNLAPTNEGATAQRPTLPAVGELLSDLGARAGAHESRASTLWYGAKASPAAVQRPGRATAGNPTLRTNTSGATSSSTWRRSMRTGARVLKRADGMFEYAKVQTRTRPAPPCADGAGPECGAKSGGGVGRDPSTLHCLRVPERRNEKCWRPGDQRKAVGRVRVVSAESKPARKPLLPGLLVNFYGGQGNGCKREKHERQSPR